MRKAADYEEDDEYSKIMGPEPDPEDEMDDWDEDEFEEDEYEEDEYEDGDE